MNLNRQSQSPIVPNMTAVGHYTGLISYTIYPALMCFGLGLHRTLDLIGVSLQIATYIPVALTLLAITILERLLPHRENWTATTPDLKTDVSFLVFVQVLLPKMLTFAASVAIAHILQDKHLVLKTLWPGAASPALQAGLMVLMADFFRYWLHVASHKFGLLWKLHSLHHAPKKLHATNVVRFHPLEKSIQYLCDALPFILLGVSPEVLSLYFVFYAINGFLQHSNIQLKLGYLNYLISGPELHRWHHSADIDESNHNYGNNLIIWDILFGSYFLPKHRHVSDLGAGEENADNFENTSVSLQLRIRSQVESVAIAIKMTWARLSTQLPLMAKTYSPDRSQKKVLKQILRANKQSRFGIDHEFSTISNYDDFKKRVPVSRYEDLRHYIDNDSNEAIGGLTSEKPVLFAQTSGTTGKPKYIPVLKRDIARYKKNQQILASDIHKHIPGAYHGKLLAMVSPAIEGHRTCGTPYGSMSGFLHQNMSKMVKSKYVVPQAIFSIADYQEKYIAIAAHALACDNISFMVTANPSSLLKLADIILEHRHRLLQIIEMGDETIDLPPKPTRAKILRKLLVDQSRCSTEPLFRLLWPMLKVVATWTAGSCKVLLPRLRSLISMSINIVELGYISSEFRGTINIDVKTNTCIPSIDENFYEFVKVNNWEAGHHDFKRITDLKVGEQYYIFVTTQSGLYRYCIDDIIEVDGYYNKTPTLRFIQKGKGITNITGEKLYENQVISAIDQTLSNSNTTAQFFMMVGCQNNLKYTVYIESDPIYNASQIIESELSKLNIEFKSKRESGRLMPTKVVFVAPGTGESYKAHCITNGQREAQFKLMHLQYAYQQSFDFPVQ